MMTWLLTLVHFAVLIMTFSQADEQEASITIPPRSVNISLNAVAEFNCTGSADAFIWEVNEEQIGNGMGIVFSTTTVNEADNILMSVLRVTASSSDVSKNITCKAFSLNPFSIVTSEPAVLMVQGLLGPVHDLTAILINSTSVLITWRPPFTLEGVPILGYNVIITNSENESISKWVDNGQLLYTPTHLEDIFPITVVPFNEVGAGQSLNTSNNPSLTTQAKLSSTVLAYNYTTPSFNKLSAFTQAANASISVTISPSPSETIKTGLTIILAWIIPLVFLFLAIILTFLCIVVWGLIRNGHKSKLHISSFLSTRTYEIQEIEQKDMQIHMKT